MFCSGLTMPQLLLLNPTLTLPIGPMIYGAIGIAFYLAWNLGANDVANSMGTSVGSKAISWRQALVIAGIFELAGALLFGQNVSARLITGVIDVGNFSARDFVSAMVAALLAAGVWMNGATGLGLPVSSSHAIVGALAGVGLVAIGPGAVHWASLGGISLTWLGTPLVSAGIAWIVYRLLFLGFLQADREADSTQIRLLEWVPWLSALIVVVFGSLVLPSVVDRVQSMVPLGLPNHTLALGLAASLAMGLMGWLLRRSPKPLASKTTIDTRAEAQFARFQLISACFVAFAHGSNDVGNAIAPLAALVQWQSTGQLPTDDLVVPFWVLAIGGLGIVAGLAVWGERVIRTVGEGIMALQPSGGFAAELATAITVLLASRLGLPVSTSHALVGAVVGVGLARSGVTRSGDSIQISTLKSILLTWIATIPLAAGLAGLMFWGLREIMGA
ncbi:MAG: hypothetical protein RLZZ511_519 [Cyanobacteriota bacterium]